MMSVDESMITEYHWDECRLVSGSSWVIHYSGSTHSPGGLGVWNIFKIF